MSNSIHINRNNECISEQHYATAPVVRASKVEGSKHKAVVTAPTANPSSSEPSDIRTGLSLPALLRGVGVATLLLSISIYLLNGWEQGSDLTRYFLLLAHTVAIAAIGLGCSRWLQEQKSARLLLMLALVFTSGNFAIIGGFFFHLWGAPVNDLLGAVTWVVGNSHQTLGILVSAVVVLVPLVWLGFTVTARRSAKAFTAVFLLSNSLLLIPSRNEYLMAGLMLVMLVGLGLAIARARAKDVTLATPEGVIARLILFVPLGILVGRNMMHSVGVMMPFMSAIAAAVILRQLALALKENSVMRQLLEVASIPASVATASTAMAIAAQSGWLWGAGLTMFFALLCSALWFELASRAASGQAVYSFMASALLTSCGLFNVLTSDNSLMPLVGTVIGLSLAVFGFQTQKRFALALGICFAVISLAMYVLAVVDNFNINGWFGLAALGVSAIVLASYIEKRGAIFKQKFGNFRTQLQTWNY